METTLSQQSIYQSISEIPSSIYQPLLEIAQKRYDAKNIKQWYLTLLDHLDQINTDYEDEAYPAIKMFPGSPQTLQCPEDNTSGNDSAVEITNSPQSFYEHTKSDTNPWSDPLSFGPLPQNQLNVTTSSNPQQISVTSHDNLDNIVPLSAHWSPTTIPFPDININELPVTTAESAKFGHDIPNSLPWWSSPSFEVISSSSKKRCASYSPSASPYQMGMSNTRMPLFVPYDSAPPQLHNHLPFTTSAEITYLPPISVIPSRKRRKVTQKGVKKFIQPLQVRQQSI